MISSLNTDERSGRLLMLKARYISKTPENCALHRKVYIMITEGKHLEEKGIKNITGSFPPSSTPLCDVGFLDQAG